MTQEMQARAQAMDFGRPFSLIQSQRVIVGAYLSYDQVLFAKLNEVPA